MRRLLALLSLVAATFASAACDPVVIGTPGDGRAHGGNGELPGSAASGNVAEGGASESHRAGTGGAANTDDSGDAGSHDDAQAGEPASGGQGGDAPSGEHAGGQAPGTSCTLELSGHVKVPRGAAVVGMDVALSGRAGAHTATGIDGDYVFARLCPGTYVVTPSCGASAVELELDADQTVDFTNAAYGCDSDVVEPRVLVVILDPTATPDGVSPPERLSTALGLGGPSDRFALSFMDAVTGATNGHVRPNGQGVTGSLQFPPLVGGFRYTPESFAACRNGAADCKAEAIDYQALDQELGLCELVEDEGIDQIWVYGVDRFNMPRVGSLTCQLWVDGSLTPQVLDVFGLRYDRGVSSFLADFQAAVDAELWSVFPNVPGDPVKNPYGLFLQACGSVAQAPNSNELDRFDVASTVPSFCDAFQSYPLAPPLPLRPLGCAAWGCTEDGYRRYWFSRLPRRRWFDSQGRYSDFWRSALLNLHVAKPDINVTCSSSDARGACQHVNDGQHGSCGVGDWGTLEQPTGWVEYQFASPRQVSEIFLYDRACGSQVLSGHVEFSDASPPLPFGALEQSGSDYLGLHFAPKLLTGLRVSIDSSNSDDSGHGPGFGEISLTFVP